MATWRSTALGAGEHEGWEVGWVDEGRVHGWEVGPEGLGSMVTTELKKIRRKCALLDGPNSPHLV